MTLPGYRPDQCGWRWPAITSNSVLRSHYLQTWSTSATFYSASSILTEMWIRHNVYTREVIFQYHRSRHGDFGKIKGGSTNINQNSPTEQQSPILITTSHHYSTLQLYCGQNSKLCENLRRPTLGGKQEFLAHYSHAERKAKFITVVIARQTDSNWAQYWWDFWSDMFERKREVKGSLLSLWLTVDLIEKLRRFWRLDSGEKCSGERLMKARVPITAF